MLPALVTLLLGIILGYLAQRSRICFIGGLRDYLLVRDTELLKGAIAFFLTAWLAFSAAQALGLIDLHATEAVAQRASSAASSVVTGPVARTLNALLPELSLRLNGTKVSVWIATVLAGLGLGLFSTLANGCPTRQHVLAAQGVRDSRLYLAGFWLGVIVFYLVTRPLLALVL